MTGGSQFITLSFQLIDKARLIQMEFFEAQDVQMSTLQQGSCDFS